MCHSLVEKRSETVRGMLGRSAAASISDAISTLVQLWWHGSKSPEEIYSLGVASEGIYLAAGTLLVFLKVMNKALSLFFERLMRLLLLTEDIVSNHSCWSTYVL